MKDKVKEFRDKNPVLDFIAGFIPGVGEAQDAHDFAHAAKKKDFGGMAMASLGLILPGMTGSQLRKIVKAGEEFAPGLFKRVFREGVQPDQLKKELQNEAKYLQSEAAKITHPEVVRNLHEDKILGDFVDRAAKGDIDIPQMIDTGISPNIITLAEYNKARLTRELPNHTRVATTLKGNQRIKGDYELHEDFGKYDYSASGEGALNNTQIKYGDLGRAQEASLELMERGIYPGDPRYDYVMRHYRAYGELMNRYGIKWGTSTRDLSKLNWDDPNFQEKLRRAIDPHARTKTKDGGDKPANLGLEVFDLPEMSPKFRQAYADAMDRVSFFWGSGKEGRNMGGVHQQLLLLPEQSKRVQIILPKAVGYKDLNLGRIQFGPRDERFLPQYMGKKKFTINDLAKRLNEDRIPYFFIQPFMDPYRGTTHAAKPGRIIQGLKKGNKICQTESKTLS